MPLTGGEATQLTQNSRDSYGPNWSPDGKQMAYAMATDDGKTNLQVLDITTGESRQLTAGKDAFGPTWHPNGKEIFFSTTEENGYAQIWNVSVGGGEPKRITNFDYYSNMGDITADGKNIMLSIHDGVGFNVAMMPLKGGEVTTLVSSEFWDTYAECSPAGDQTLFLTTRNGNSDIGISSMDGKVQKILTNSEGDEFNCKWMPDGKSIIFTREDSSSDLMARDMASM
jgi:TolB protein